MGVTYTVDDLGPRLCNWDKWGSEDELGTLNFITERKVLEGAGAVRKGVIIELGVPLDRDGPQKASPRRFNPLHFMTALPSDTVRPDGCGIADDVLVLPLQAGTQWDALSHFSYNGTIYGGRSVSRVTSGGAQANSIRAISARVATRGVLVDVARHRGVDWLEPGYAITASDLSSTLDQEGVKAGEGDIILVRTGFLAHSRNRGWEGYSDHAPGLGLDTLEWIHERRLAGVATDTVALEVKPSQIQGFRSPFHAVGLVYMGLLLGEMFDLDRLANACAKDGAYDFFFVAAPLPVTGAVGSPINPYAIR
jgi:kynurenine formamidase